MPEEYEINGVTIKKYDLYSGFYPFGTTADMTGYFLYLSKTDDIEELYTNFKLFVNAFCTTYGVELNEDDYYDDFDDEDGDMYV